MEISGEFTQTVGPDEVRVIWVAIGDCLADKADVKGRDLVAADGKFFIEVFPPCGSDLTLCASIEPKGAMPNNPLPTARYGKLERTLHAEGQGEIEFKNLHVTTGTGPVHAFATPYAR